MCNEIGSPPCLFIGGTGRSGTNVLKDRFTTHSMVAALPFESRFSVDPDGVFATYRALQAGATPFEMNILLARMEKLLVSLASRSLTDSLYLHLEKVLKMLFGSNLNLRKYKEWELEKHLPKFSSACEDLLRSLTSAVYTGVWPGHTGSRNRSNNRISLSANDPKLIRIFQVFLSKLYNAFLEVNGASVLVDDNTYNLMYAKELTLLMPNAHLVHIIRDPRDVVASFLQQRWSPNTINEAIIFYSVSMDNILKMLGSINKEKFTVIKLEELCIEPNIHMRDLESKVGLTDGNLFSTKDFSGSNQGRWKKNISINNHSMLNKKLESYIKLFGYDK